MPQVDIKDAATLVGEESVSEWLEITQERINAFADATDDHQWIHVDVERAKREMGGTIAHGFLTLSLLPALREQAGGFDISGVNRKINYGFNKIRFTNMVPVGSRVRVRNKLTDAQPRGGGGMALTWDVTLEIQGADKPALIAEWVTMVFP